MEVAMGICADELDGLTSEIVSEVEPDETEDEVLPEGTVEPDEETTYLIDDVIKVAEEFRPAHTKLKKIIEANRVKIVLLENKFGVKKGFEAALHNHTSRGSITGSGASRRGDWNCGCVGSAECGTRLSGGTGTERQQNAATVVSEACSEQPR
jgi:hypothetical protein